MGRVATILLVCAAVLPLMPGSPAPAQDPARAIQARLQALPQPDGIILRWLIVGGPFPTDGVELFRRPHAGGAWTRVAGPLRQAARAEILSRLPEERAQTVRAADEQAGAMSEERRSRSAAFRFMTDFILACEFPELVGPMAVGVTDPAPAGAAYDYQLRDASGRELGSLENLRPGEPPALSAPEGLTAGILPASIRLTWNPPTEGAIAGYEVLRAAAGTDNWASISPGLVPAILQEGSSPFYLDDTIEVGASYRYAVAVRDLFGRSSGPCAPVSVQMADIVPPAPPNAPVVEVGDGGSTHITWDAPPEDAASVRLYQADNDDMLNPVVVGEYTPAQRDVTLHLEVGLFFYYLRAVDAAGNESAPSAVGMASVDDLDPPGVPTDVEATGERGRIRVQWQAPGDADVAGYLVYRGLSEQPEDFALVRAEPFTEPSYLDEINEIVQNEFYYRVRAVDQAGNEGELSEIAHARMPDVTPPSAPVMRGIRTGEGWVEIEWAPMSPRDVTGFHVERRSDGEWERITQEALGADARTHRDEGIAGGARQEYRVIAVDAAGHESEPSRELAARLPNADAAAAPRGLQGELLPSGTIRLQWTANTEADLYGYIVERATAEEAPFSALGGRVTETAFEDRRVEPGTTYRYRVVAYNERGVRSEPSEVVEVEVPEQEE